MGVVIRSIGMSTPIGDNQTTFVQSIAQVKKGFSPIERFQHLPSPLGARVQNQSVRGVLKKRKDAKLFSPAAALGLLAAKRCLGALERKDDLGLFGELFWFLG